MRLHVLIAMVAGWIHRHQQHVITYLKEENRVLTSKLPGGGLRLSDTERRELAALAYPHRFIILGEASLRHALREYLAHYHTERNHQGLENHLIAPEVEVGGHTGQVVCRERLGGC
jgi:hypothetical protein